MDGGIAVVGRFVDIKFAITSQMLHNRQMTSWFRRSREWILHESNEGEERGDDEMRMRDGMGQDVMNLNCYKPTFCCMMKWIERIDIGTIVQKTFQRSW